MKILKSITVLASGTMVAQVATIIITPILAKIYEPLHFGFFSIFISIVNPINAISLLRYQMALPLIQDNKEKKAIFYLSFIILFAMLALASILTPFAYVLIFEHLDYAMVFFLSFLTVLSVFLGGLFYLFAFLEVSNQKYTIISMATIIQVLAQLLMQVVLGLFFENNYSLILAFIFGQILGLSVFLWVERRLFYEKLPRFIDLKEVLFKYKKFPIISGPSALLEMIAASVPNLLIGYLYGVNAAGQYLFIQRLADAAFRLIKNSIGQVFYKQGADIFKTEPRNFRRFYLKILLIISSLSLIASMFVYIFGGSIILILFGEKWATSGEILYILIPFYSVNVVFNSLNQVCLIIDKMGFQLAYDFVAAFATFFIFYYFNKMNFSLFEVLEVFSISRSLMVFLMFILYYKIISLKSKNLMS